MYLFKLVFSKFLKYLKLDTFHKCGGKDTFNLIIHIQIFCPGMGQTFYVFNAFEQLWCINVMDYWITITLLIERTYWKALLYKIFLLSWKQQTGSWEGLIITLIRGPRWTQYWSIIRGQKRTNMIMRYLNYP